MPTATEFKAKLILIAISVGCAREICGIVGTVTSADTSAVRLVMDVAVFRISTGGMQSKRRNGNQVREGGLWTFYEDQIQGSTVGMSLNAPLSSIEFFLLTRF